jgi:predicted enzyme related to lactoylglutathione lyase
MSHPIVHVEFSARDHREAARFYNDIFGWKTQEYPEMNYTTFETGDGGGGGFNPVQEDYPAGTVMVYIKTDDIEATLAQIEAHGGKTVVAKLEIPTVGWMAVFSDPTGNNVALLTPLSEES